MVDVVDHFSYDIGVPLEDLLDLVCGKEICLLPLLCLDWLDCRDIWTHRGGGGGRRRNTSVLLHFCGIWRLRLRLNRLLCLHTRLIWVILVHGRRGIVRGGDGSGRIWNSGVRPGLESVYSSEPEKLQYSPEPLPLEHTSLNISVTFKANEWGTSSLDSQAAFKTSLRRTSVLRALLSG